MKKEKSKRILWQLVKPFKIHLLILAIVGVIWAVFTVAKSYVLKVMVDSIVNNGLQNLFWPITLYFASWIMTEWFARIRDYVVMYLKPYLKKHIITVVSARMLEYDDHYFRANQPGGLINGLRNLYDGIDDGIYIVEELFSHCMLIFSTLVSMFIINKYFSFIAIAWFVLWAFLARIWAHNGHVLAYLMNESRTKLSFNLSDIFANTSTIKTFNALDYENKITEQIAQEAAGIEFKREKMFLKVWIVQGVLFFLVSGSIFWLLISLYGKGQVTIGDFAMLIDLLHTVYTSLFDFAKDVSELSEVTGKVKQGLDVVYRENMVKKHVGSNQILKIKSGEIIFDKIKYRYPESKEEETAFDSQKVITIPAGANVAIIGPSGSGKTTLIKLLLRLLDPVSGKILIDGKDIAHYDIKSVRNVFALVPQDLGIFHRSIKDNIKYGMEATDEEVIKAAKKARIHDAICAMTNGYETIYGNETGLSGGQRQRIMIARGLLRKAKIFVFDESTSALDVQTEYDIFKNIKETTVGCTKLIIAHRLSTIRNSDLILVCDHGEIVESGTHDSLMAHQGLYYSLINIA